MKSYQGHGENRFVTIVANEESFEYAAQHLNSLKKEEWAQLYEMYNLGATMKEFSEWFFQNWDESNCKGYGDE